jgi:hypothetical protein
MDLQLSGPAAQYGRGMVGDVTAVLLRDFAANMQQRIDAIEQGVSPDQIGSAAPARGFRVAFAATRLALGRVAARFFRPYRPAL